MTDPRDETGESNRPVAGSMLPPAIIFALIVAAVNPWTVAYLFSRDGILSPQTARWVWVIGLTLGIAAGGIVFLRDHAARFLSRALRRYPRAVALGFGFALCLGLWVFAEGVAYSVMVHGDRATDAHYTSPTMTPGTVAHASLSIGDRTVYDVSYSLDAEGFRITPGQAERDASRSILVFGGSFSFGEGVSDDETLPHALADVLPGFRVLNRAFPGHGPSQMLQQLRDGALTKTDPGHEVWAVYIFIPGHVRRAIGSMRVMTGWGKDFADYAFPNPDGPPTSSGTFTTARPLLSRVYGLLAKDAVLRYFNVDFPMVLREEHLAHTARIIGAARDAFAENAPSENFVVAIYPHHERDEFPGARIAPYLEALNVRVLDYSELFADDPAMWLEHDGHPTAAAHDRLGEALAGDWVN